MPNNIEVIQNEAERITKITVDGDSTEYIYDADGTCIGFYDEKGNPVVVNEDADDSEPSDDEYSETGTDLQLGKYDAEVMNGNGWYDDDGDYRAYSTVDCFGEPIS